MYQQTTIVGNVGKEPEMRYTPDGKPVTTFSVAVNQHGDSKPPVWFRVTCWEKLAETCNQYVHKSNRVLVAGELQPAHAWLGQDGQPRASYELTARVVRFMTSNSEREQTAEGSAPDTEDIPF